RTPPPSSAIPAPLTTTASHVRAPRRDALRRFAFYGPKAASHERIAQRRIRRDSREKLEWRDAESNRGHHDFQSCALPTELSRRTPANRQLFARLADPRGGSVDRPFIAGRRHDVAKAGWAQP